MGVMIVSPTSDPVNLLYFLSGLAIEKEISIRGVF